MIGVAVEGEGGSAYYVGGVLLVRCFCVFQPTMKNVFTAQS